MTQSKKILYLQYANPAAFPPIEYSSRILAERGWAVRLLGVHSQGSENMSFPEHSGIVTEVMPYVAPGWRQKLAYLKFIVRSFLVARSWKPEWVYVSDLMATPAGLLIGRLLGIKMIYHEHDSPHEVAPSVFIRLIMLARKHLSQLVEFNILPQAERAQIFRSVVDTKRPIYCVWNCPMSQDALIENHKQRKDGEPLGLYFHGTLNVGMTSLALIEGCRRSGVRVRLRLVGYETIGSIGTSAALREAADKAGPSIELELPGAFSRHELVGQMEGMHVGWMAYNREPDNVNLVYLAGASNKAFDYLAAGMPLIVRNDQDWTDMFERPDYARSCEPNNPDSIAQAIRWFHNHPDETAKMGKLGREKILADWNYETCFQEVVRIMENESKSIGCVVVPLQNKDQ